MKFKYIVVTGKSDKEATELVVNEVACANKFKSFQDFLNSFGDQEWELVTLQHISSSKGFIATFKKEVYVDKYCTGPR